jgi:metallo-beta-lactamase family protein
VNAEVAKLDNLSAHADYVEIMDWLNHFENAPRETFVTHGEPVPAEVMRARIEETLGWRARVPRYLETVELTPGSGGTDTGPHPVPADLATGG